MNMASSPKVLGAGVVRGAHVIGAGAGTGAGAGGLEGSGLGGGGQGAGGRGRRDGRGWRGGARWAGRGEYITTYIIHTMRGRRGSHTLRSRRGLGCAKGALIVVAKSASGREGSPPRRSLRSRVTVFAGAYFA